jgi:hypothetical protein
MEETFMSRLISAVAVALLVVSVVAQLPAAFREASYSVKMTTAASPAAAEAAKVPAVEFVVTSQDRFPARALDPVLHVGNLEVRQYRYADISNKTLVFTLFELDKLNDDVPVYLQYGGDKRTRTDLPRFYRSMLHAQ